MSERRNSEANQAFASLKLEGIRFSGANIPVDVLEEIVRYRNLIVAAATDAWQEEHPNDDLPDWLSKDLELTLTEVANGSAIPVLDRPSGSDFEKTFEDARDAVDHLIREVSNGKVTKTSFPSWANTPAFWNFGSSLEGGEKMYVPAPTQVDPIYAVITPETRRLHVEPLKLSVKGERSDSFQIVGGQVIALDAENRSFELMTTRWGQIHGRFKDTRLIQDLSSVIGNSNQAKTVSIFGRTGLKDGILEKVHEAFSIVNPGSEFEYAFDQLVKISKTEEGWLGGSGSEVPPKVIIKGATVLSIFTRLNFPPPAVFPTEAGGLVFEWGSETYVLSVEIEDNGNLVVYSLLPGKTSGAEITVREPEELLPTLTGWGEVLNA